MASFPDVGYPEYYTRLAETASTWQTLKAKLASSFPGRPVSSSCTTGIINPC